MSKYEIKEAKGSMIQTENYRKSLRLPTADSMATSRWVYISCVAVDTAGITALSWWFAPAMLSFLQSDLIVEAERLPSDALHGAASHALTSFMTWVSWVHRTAGICVLAAIAGVEFLRHLKYLPLTFLMLVVPGGLLLNVAVKHAVQRPRPDWRYALQVLDTYSFPSGHTVGATLYYAVVVIMLWPHLPKVGVRFCLVTTVTSVVLLVALSRIYLGVHFMTDCLAAVIEALLWLGICLSGTSLHPAAVATPRDET